MRISSPVKLGLAAVAMLGVAVCSLSPAFAQASGNVTVISWRYADPSAIGKLHYQLVDDFNASQSDIKVTAEAVPYPDVMTKLVNAVLSGSPPDVMAISPSLLPSVAYGTSLPFSSRYSIRSVTILTGTPST